MFSWPSVMSMSSAPGIAAPAATTATEGRLATAGNLAFPFTPPEVMIGEAYRFNVFHLMDVDDMARLFPAELETVGR